MKRLLIVFLILSLVSISFTQEGIQVGITLEERTNMYTGALEIASEMPRISEEYNIKTENTDVERIIEVDNKSLFIQLRNQQVDIVVSKEEDKMIRVIQTPKVTIATTQEFDVEDGIIHINQTEINMNHITQVSRDVGVNIEFVNLEFEDNRLVYKTNVIHNRKILGFFDVEIDSEIEIDVESGKLIRHRRPWWYFLTTS